MITIVQVLNFFYNNKIFQNLRIDAEKFSTLKFCRLGWSLWWSTKVLLHYAKIYHAEKFSTLKFCRLGWSL